MINDLKCGGTIDMSFGAILKRIRISNKLTLREYCRKFGVDPGNYSKLERNILPPPKDRFDIEKLIRNLVIDPSEKNHLFIAALNHHIGALQERFK